MYKIIVIIFEYKKNRIPSLVHADIVLIYCRKLKNASPKYNLYEKCNAYGLHSIA